MEKNALNKNREFVKANLDKLLSIYLNKYILLYNEEVVGSFDSYESAAEEGINNYGIEGDFLVYYVTESTPVNFVSTAMI